jgi:surface antigen
MNIVSYLRRFLLVLALALPCVALATPPPWAPAHGWRKKHDPYYAGYSGRNWDQDYGVREGRCDRTAIGAVLGGIAGGAIGSQVGSPDNRAVAVIVGTVIGAAVGAEIGRRMDDADRSCTAHALELASTNQSVSWTNSKSGVTYKLTPVAEEPDERCRKFRLIATGAFGLSEGRTTACATDSGVWKLAPEIKMSRR